LFSLGSEKAIRFKKLMKSQILALGASSVTTNQPQNVSLYSKKTSDYFICTVRSIFEEKLEKK
jgi:hypothetical protein